MPQSAFELDLDHALRNAEPLRDPLMRLLIEPRCNQDGAAAPGKLPDRVFKDRQVTTGFEFLRLAGHLVDDIFKNGIDVGAPRPPRFEALTIRRKIERHAGDIGIRVSHHRDVVNPVESKPRLVQGFAREVLGAETPRQKDPEFIVSLDKSSAQRHPRLGHDAAVRKGAKPAATKADALAAGPAALRTPPRCVSANLSSAIYRLARIRSAEAQSPVTSGGRGAITMVIGWDSSRGGASPTVRCSTAATI